ncbi:MAG TPA: ThuA domain-containing protein [Actinophytocola sp.]|uniref:ThuA domain-containing protein n=1 Tax=Actinophytocola sp. TaxID=1872138 RepID=UPI002DFEC79A|nr:ThuA domain-containing protein [Actinophytocola sp.]
MRPHLRRALATHLVLPALLSSLLVTVNPLAAPAAPLPDSGSAVEGGGSHYKVLVFTGTAGAPQPSTAAGVDAIRRLGTELRFSTQVTADPRVFDKPHLKKYRVVVFLNNAGDVLSDAEQAAFEAYFHDGGGFVGIHTAIEAEPGWSFLTDVLGTRASGAAPVSQAVVKVADRVHPASANLPDRWTRTDRWYNFTSSVRGFAHVMSTVDESTFAGGTMGFDHPITWCKDFQGGRSFYTGFGGTPSSFREAGMRSHLGGAIRWAAGLTDGDCGATVLANYQMDFIAAPPNVSEPIGFDVLPDGRVVQTDRRGGVRLHDPATNTTHLLAQIPVYMASEDGMYGPAVDNDFATNRWIYLYYSPPLSTPVANAPNTGADPSVWDPWLGYFQLSRFKLLDGPAPTLDLASEQQILRVPVNRGACCHVAGDIDFDKHNNLWLVTGDDTPSGGGNSGGFAPFNDMLTTTGLFNAPHVDARRSAQNTNDLRGKILRITVRPDGSYTAPAGNLFAPGTALTRPEIYAMGLRNPFRITVDDDDVAFVTDYSPDSQTPQVFRGPAGTGRMMTVRRPANYGWPLCYSPDLPYYRWNFNTSTPLDDPPQAFECNNPAHGPENTSRWNTGLTVTPPVARPEVWYSYQDNNPANPLGTPCPAYYRQNPPGTCPQLFPELGTGGVGPHGAAKYDYNPANPNPTKFPKYYDGAIFFGEFTRDYLREIRLDSSGAVFKINDLLNCGQAPTTPTKPFLCDNPMDMMWGKDGNFYLLTYGDGFFNINPDAALVKFSYVKGLRAPIAVLNATPADGVAPLTVAFSSEGSRDPDPGDSIKFSWDLDGNGTVDSIEPNPTFTYSANGVYTARLTVTDSSGKTASANTTITVGNTSPSVHLTVPAAGGLFSFGDTIPFAVTVSDPEDGPIDCGRVQVTFVLGHDSHGHAEATANGCTGTLPTEAEDVSHGGNVFGVISAWYTDLGGSGGVPALTTVDQVTILQKHQEVEFAVDQSGTNTAPTTDAGGGLQRGSLGNGDWIALNGTYRLVDINSITFRTSGGTGLVEIHQDTVDGPLLSTVTIAATADANTYASQVFPLADPGGAHRLYLVFRPAPGGPANNFFNLNWVEFGGAGIGL